MGQGVSGLPGNRPGDGFARERAEPRRVRKQGPRPALGRRLSGDGSRDPQRGSRDIRVANALPPLGDFGGNRR